MNKHNIVGVKTSTCLMGHHHGEPGSEVSININGTIHGIIQ